MNNHSNHPTNYYQEPYVIEEENGLKHSWNLSSRLIKDRIIFVTGTVEDEMATSLAKQILYLLKEDANQEIVMYVNSPGGSVIAGNIILDIMDFAKQTCIVSTQCIGLAASMGSVILSNGSKGHRYALPSARIMLHQASAGTGGNIQDMRVALEEFNFLNEQILTRLVENMSSDEKSITVKELEDLTNRDLWLSAEKSLELGLIDIVLNLKTKK